MHAQEQSSSIRGILEGPAELVGAQDTATVCDAVRRQYSGILRQSLLANVNSIRPYGYYTEKTVDQVLIPLSKNMEKYALSKSMKSKIYRKSLTDTVRNSMHLKFGS